jgi:hypothetical protein
MLTFPKKHQDGVTHAIPIVIQATTNVTALGYRLEKSMNARASTLIRNTAIAI